MEVLILLRIEVPKHPIEQDLREADHRVEGSAKFMRHVCEELRFVTCRLKELLVDGLDLGCPLADSILQSLIQLLQLRQDSFLLADVSLQSPGHIVEAESELPDLVP